MGTLDHWLHELAKEICERLEQDELENNRRPKQLVVSYMQAINNNDVSSSRSLNLTTIDEEKIVNDALDVLKRNTEKFFTSADNNQQLNNPIKFLGLSVGKFETQDSKRSNTIQNMFKKTIDTQAKIDGTKDNNSVAETNVESQSNDKLDVSGSTKKPATIQDMFKARTGDTLEKIEELPSADTGIDLKKSTGDTSAKQSFFAKFKLSKPIAPTYDTEIHPSTFTDGTTEEPEPETEMDDHDSFGNDVLLEEIAQNEQVISQMRPSSPIASTSKSTDYRQTYAEFYRPPPNLEMPKEKCPECNKMVNAYEMQVHTDEHFAFQLTQEQRIEFKNQTQTSTVAVATPPAAKKLKTCKSSTVTINTFSIDKFLVKKDTSQIGVAGSSSAMDVETETCAECGKNIPIVDILEHMDYHAAKKLHEELLKSEMALNRSATSAMKDAKPKTDAIIGGKRNKNKKKSNNNNSNKSTNNNSTKSIVTFFQNT